MTAEAEVETKCQQAGCGHDLDRHKIEDIRVWTTYGDHGELRSSTMGYTMVCYDVCEDVSRSLHQCHCKRYESPMPKPTPEQLHEP